MGIRKALVHPKKGLHLWMRVALSASTIPSPPRTTEAAQHTLPQFSQTSQSSSGTGGHRASCQMVWKLARIHSPLLPHTEYPRAKRHTHRHLHGDTHHSLNSTYTHNKVMLKHNHPKYTCPPSIDKKRGQQGQGRQ